MKDDDHKDAAVSATEGQGTARASSMGWFPYLVLCAVGLTIGLTSIGPSASEGLGTLNRMGFWAAHVIPALALLALTQAALGRIERVSALPGIAQVMLSAMIASLVFAPIALGIDSLLAGEGALDADEDPLLIRLGSELAHFFVPLVLIWSLINAPSLLQLERAGVPTKALDDPLPKKNDKALDAEAEFWSRVPGRLGRQLVALSAELHYLRVYTTAGDTLILFPFGRAVDILQDQHGMQVHRSHWVALDQIDEVITRDGRVACQMIGGLTLPVSRSYRSALKAARRVST